MPLCVGLALLAGLWSVQRITLVPPGVEPRTHEIATASTRALVDAPRSTLVNLGVNTNDLGGSVSRALLISNVMTSAPVREYIARRAGIPADAIQITSPITPDFPRPLSSRTKRYSATDILKRPDEFRLSLHNNPTVPMIDVYAEAPTPDAAKRLANGAIEGTRDYLAALGAQQRIPPAERVLLRQLGAAEGETINDGIDLKVAVLSFLLVLFATSALAWLLGRVQRGWRQAELAAD